MSDSKISALPPAALLTGTELVPVVQSGISVRSTVSAIGNNALGIYTAPGVGAVAQTVSAKLAQTVSVFDFMSVAQIADAQARTHGIDLTTVIQAAITAAETGGFSLLFPNGDYTVSSPLSITAPIQILGIGSVPSIGSPLGTGQRGPGSWFYFNHAGKGIICQQPSAGNPISGIELRQFGTFRNQPVPGVGWAPNANDYDIWCDNVDIYIDDVMLLNATAGVYATDESLNGYGRIDINRLRGQVFNDMIHLDGEFDVCKISNVQRWPFWSAGSANFANVQSYENQNANTLYLGRCDSPMITNVFAFNGNTLVRFATTAKGSTTYAQFNNVNADNTIYGVLVDSTVTNLLAQFENFVSLAPTTTYITGSNNIRVDGINAQLDFGKCELRQAQQNAVQVNGSNNRVSFGGVFQAVVYNQAAGGFNAIQVNGANSVSFGMRPIIDASGPAKYAGTGNIWVDDWRAYTPTITASAGTITTVGALSCWFKMVSSTVSINYDITITTNGTGASVLQFTLPGAPVSVAPGIVGAGRELNVTGSTLTAYLAVGATFASIVTYNNAYPGANGARIVGTLQYQCAGL